MLSQDGSRPETFVLAVSPISTRRGCMGICRVQEALAREFVSDLFEFAVDVSYGSGTACLSKLHTKVKKI